MVEGIVLEEWAKIRKVINEGNLDHIRESIAADYEKELEKTYRSDFEKFKKHLKRSIEMLIFNKYRSIENSGGEVNWEEVKKSISDDKIFSKDTIEDVVSSVITVLPYGEIRRKPGKSYWTRKISKDGDDDSKNQVILEIDTDMLESVKNRIPSLKVDTDFLWKFLENIQLTPLEDLMDDYIEEIQKPQDEKNKVIEKRLYKNIFKELKQSIPDLKTTAYDAKISFKNGLKEYSVKYNATKGEIVLYVKGQSSLKEAQKYFPLKISSGNFTYAGGNGSMSLLNSLFSSIDFEKRKKELIEQSLGYEPIEDPNIVSIVSGFNLSPEDAEKMILELKPLCESINSSNDEISKIKKKYVDKSEMKFDAELQKYGEGFKAKVKLDYKEEIIAFQAEYKISLNNISAVDVLFQ